MATWWVLICKPNFMEHSDHQVALRCRGFLPFPTFLCLSPRISSLKMCGFLSAWKFLLSFVCLWTSALYKMCGFQPPGPCLYLPTVTPVCGILVHRPGIKPTSPASEGRFLTTAPPGKSRTFCISNPNHHERGSGWFNWSLSFLMGKTASIQSLSFVTSQPTDRLLSGLIAQSVVFRVWELQNQKLWSLLPKGLPRGTFFYMRYRRVLLELCYWYDLQLIY